MFYLRDLLGAHFAGRLGALRILDELTLPGWLDRRLGWSKKRDLRRHRLVERTEEKPPVGKDATRDL